MKKFNLSKIVFLSLAMLGLFVSAYLPKAGTEEEIGIPDETVTISMDFKDADLKDVLKVFSIQSGLNTIASEAVQSRKITLYMDKVPVREALNKIFRANNLTYEIDEKSNIILVKDWGKPEIEVITKVFRLKYNRLTNSRINTEINNYLFQTSTSGSTGTGISSVTGTSTSGTTSGTGGSGATITGDEGITQSLKKILSKQGLITEDIRSNSLIITDVPSKFPVIEATVAALDVPVPQVMLEVEMLDVNKNQVDKIGFKYGTTPFTIVLKGGTQTMGLPFGNWSKAIGAPPTGSVSINATDATAYQVQFDFLRTLTDTKILARPRIFTLSNETAEIKIITDEAIGVTSVTTTGGAAGTVTATAERTETGVMLRITPQVNPQTGEITMFVMPVVADASSTTVSFTSAGTTNTFKNPEIRTTKSVVRIRDGDTIVLGGLIRKENTTVITKLPLLGDIPLLGAVFRHKSVDPGKDRELLVFITPRIIKEGNLELAQATTKKPEMPEAQRNDAMINALREYGNE